MSRLMPLFGLLAVVCTAVVPSLGLAEVSGVYMESRTCQVYTGPCFANGEIGLAGRNAVMAWKIEEGDRDGVDLSGLSVVVVVSATNTLEFKGLDGPKDLKSVILVDEKADKAQREALMQFARQHAGRAGKSAVRVDCVPIAMSLETSELRGSLLAGKEVKLNTRKARPGDCICSNEAAYYPPLAKVTNLAPGVALDSEFKGRGLGRRWSMPGSRSVYMATFDY